MSYGVGVERIFPEHSPRYSSIDVLSKGDVRRNRLFYLRALRGKASRVDTQEELLETAAPTSPAEPATEGTSEAPAAAPAPKGKKGKGGKAAAAQQG